ncbi:hypothetical protein V6Z11_A01G035400 [Gossypium hirsutum]
MKIKLTLKGLLELSMEIMVGRRYLWHSRQSGFRVGNIFKE